MELNLSKKNLKDKKVSDKLPDLQNQTQPSKDNKNINTTKSKNKNKKYFIAERRFNSKLKGNIAVQHIFRHLPMPRFGCRH